MCHVLMNRLFSRYNLKDSHKHGEAGSVDVAAVEVEWERLSKILVRYAKKDHLNFDESGLFAM